jgi:hypothetical protein
MLIFLQTESVSRWRESMSTQIELGDRWPKELSRQLVSGLPDACLLEHWGSHRSHSSQSSAGSPANIRNQLVAWAREDAEVRRWIVKTWRDANAEVAAAVDHAVTEGITSNRVRMLDQFEAVDVLLALLTDEFEDGCKLAHLFINHGKSVNQRRDLLLVLQSLAGNDDDASSTKPRLVIIGGNARDESRLRRRLFENSSLSVRWKTFEKKQGGDAVDKDVIGALRHADAAIIITGTASHTLVQIAKEYVKRVGVPWTCIDKASYTQMTSALQQLFQSSIPDAGHVRKDSWIHHGDFASSGYTNISDISLDGRTGTPT